MSRPGYHLSINDAKQVNKSQDLSRIYVGEVMDARSPGKNGELKLWLLNSSTDKEDPKNWIIARSCMGVFGNTINERKSSNINTTSYSLLNTSFGNWSPMPYVGNHVFVFFPCVSGENTIAYWFGSPMFSTNLMLPGISYNLSSSNYDAVGEYNYNEPIHNNSSYSPLQNALKIQGLDNDRLRGISTASTFRDNPSHCYGFLSPLGNQMVIDDGWSLGDSNINWDNDPRYSNTDNNEKDDYGSYHSKKEWISSLKSKDKENELNRFHGGFRFRTRNGTQILILDAGNIYMINKDGTAWMELSDDGYIDCYSAFGINAASEGDINLHAPTINIEATDTLTLKAGKNIILDTAGKISANSNVFTASTKITVPTINAKFGNINSITSGAANMTGIFAGTLQGTALYATSSGMVPIEQPMPDTSSAEIEDVDTPEYYDVEQQVNNSTTTSINTRIPTHEPWAGHNKNEYIPNLIIKQITKKEEIKTVNNFIESNIIK